MATIVYTSHGNLIITKYSMSDYKGSEQVNGVSAFLFFDTIVSHSPSKQWQMPITEIKISL